MWPSTEEPGGFGAGVCCECGHRCDGRGDCPSCGVSLFTFAVERPPLPRPLKRPAQNYRLMEATAGLNANDPH